MSNTENTKITPRNMRGVEAPAPFTQKSSVTQANEFQASLEKNRASAGKANPHVAQTDERSPRIAATPTDPFNLELVVTVEDRNFKEAFYLSPEQDTKTATEYSVGTDVQSVPSVVSVPDSLVLETEAALFSDLSQRLDSSKLSTGEFDVLLPSGQGISVNYDVSNSLTRVVLRTPNSVLSQQLKQCAKHIGEALTLRCARPIEVTAM